MGDRYILDLKCIYCNNVEHDVWYAPTSGSYTFQCHSCNKTTFITHDLKTKRIEDVSIDDLRDAFLSATNTTWDDKTVQKICEETLVTIQQKT